MKLAEKSTAVRLPITQQQLAEMWTDTRRHAQKQEAKRQRMHGHVLWEDSGITVDYQLAGQIFTARVLKARVHHELYRVDEAGRRYTQERPRQLVIEGHGGLVVIDCLNGHGLVTIGYTVRPIQLLAPLIIAPESA